LALQKPEKVNEMELILSEIQNNDLDNFENESKNYKDLEENRRAEEELKKLGYL
jgi:hypothetical protein